MQDNTKRIAKNTVFLYIRMFVMMLIGLYTSRVILNVLGVEDYGIYNVVGGVVSMFSLLTAAMSSSISRFLTVELGRGDIDRLRSVFSTSLNVQLIMSAIIIIATEIVGVWFLNQKINIPTERLDSANWVMQCSILTFVVNLLMSPYNASIVSHEKMGIYAYVSVLDAVMKLVIVFALYYSPFDKLKSYAVLLLVVSLLTTSIYWLYCNHFFKECRYYIRMDSKLLKEIVSYAGWGVVGDGAWVLNTQGVNILINLFFGVTLNAARGIATTVDNIVQQFVRNFMVALNPQITKSYASGDFRYMHKLIFFGSKYSYFLMFLGVLPLCLETEFLLTLWLKTVPVYAVAFTQLSLIATLCWTWSNTLTTAIAATGDIKKYELAVGLSYLSIFPISWLLFAIGLSPISCYVITIIVLLFVVFIKIRLSVRMIHLSAFDYFRAVILRIIYVTILSVLPGLLVCLTQSDSLMRLLEVVPLSIFCTLLAIWFVGITKEEKSYLCSFMKKRLNIKFDL